MAVQDCGQAWLAAMARGVVSLEAAALADCHGLPAPSLVPYLDMAVAADNARGGIGLDQVIALLAPGEAFGARLAGWPAVRRLLDAGVPPAFLAQLTGAGDLWAGRCLLKGGFFDMGGPDGRLILLLRDDFGQLVDAVAITLACETEWTRLTGACDILGAWNLDHARWNGGALRLHETPMDWLRAGGDGICVLDWTATAVGDLRCLGEQVTLRTSAGQGARLRARMERGGLPLVAEELPAGQRLSLAERIGRGGIGGLHG